ARVIQEHIKKPLADQVLFGDLVKGGTVRVDIDQNEKGKTVGLKLESVAEPVQPKRDPVPAKAKKKAPAKRKTTKATSKTSSGGRRKSGGSSGSGRGTVPKVPLKT
ncbi:MAG: ATP-dependent Clp protease ATP-binding subunit ClpA, partial [Cohaesibacteraceae bacterium]